MRTEDYDVIQRLRRNGQFDEAIALLREAIATSPMSNGQPPAAPYRFLAQCYRDTGQIDAEIALLVAYRAAGGTDRGLVARYERALRLSQRGDAIDLAIVASMEGYQPRTARGRIDILRQLRGVLNQQGRELDDSPESVAIAEAWARKSSERAYAWRRWRAYCGQARVPDADVSGSGERSER